MKKNATMKNNTVCKNTPFIVGHPSSVTPPKDLFVNVLAILFIVRYVPP